MLKEEILKYKGIEGGGEEEDLSGYNACPDFENSINADFEAAQGVLDLMDFRTVSKFIDYIENCKGSVLVSGIGKHLTAFFVQYLSELRPFLCGKTCQNNVKEKTFDKLSD